MRAIVLSAGYGTRLWPLTEDRTKPAIPILGKPLVGYVAEYLAGYGIDEIVVNLHHRPESVRRALGDGSQFGVKLHYVEEPVILGTSGALDNTREFFERETFVVSQWKDHHRHRFERCSRNSPKDKCHRHAGSSCPTLVANVSAWLKLKQVESRASVECQWRRDGPVPLMFTGIQILEPRIFEYIPRGVFSHSTTDVYPQAIAQRRNRRRSRCFREMARTVDVAKISRHQRRVVEGDWKVIHRRS